MKYEIRFTSQFKKDYRLAQKRNLPLDELNRIIAMLAEGIELPEDLHDHALLVNFKRCRECHIRPNWLLIYKVFENILVLELTRTGTHSDLFE